jgi:hypothetical protein
VDRRSTTSRPGSLSDTKRVPTIDYAPTRVFRQTRHTRTPVRALAVVVLDRDARGCPLAHPRLVRRAQPSAPSSPPPRLGEFEDEPTDERR